MEIQENLVYIDDLTGFFNRRYLYSQLPKYLQEAQAAKDKLWLFMLDVDNFKLVNDTYGHLSGDELIKDVAAVLKENTKTEDKRIRYAGDEFTIILPGVDVNGIINIAKRLIARVDAAHFREKHSGREMHVTISVGIAGYPQDTSDPLELINLADKALYISKQKGKNCISVVSEIRPELFWKKGLLERFPCAVLIGRDQQLRKLNDALMQSMHAVSNFCLVSGEMGVGKSRLLNEFEAAIPNHEVNVLSLCCEDRFVHQSFYALGTILDRYLLGLDKLPQGIFNGISEDQQSAFYRFFPALRNLAKADNIPAAGASLLSGDDLSPPILKLLRNISQISPLCMIFDDFHYCDAKSLKALIHFMREYRDANVMVLAAYSRDIISQQNADDYPLASVIETEEFKGHIQTITLSALKRQESETMISTLLAKIPLAADFTTVLYGLTKGNPLFIEELLKYLIEKEVICYKDGRWVQQPLDEAGLPSSVEEAIQRRLDDLDDETKEMITKAAVIGNDFHIDMLQKIGSEDKGYILDLIEAGKKVGLLSEKLPHGRDEFTFIPSAVRNILFKVFNAERLRQLYLRLGEAKEKLYSDHLNSVAGDLSHDFKNAQDHARAEQYEKLAKENQALFDESAMQYAQALVEKTAQVKDGLALSKNAWGLIPVLIRSICTALNNYVLYPAQNKMRINSIEDVYKKLTGMLSEIDILNIAIVESNVIVNNKKVGKELSAFFADTFIAVLKNLDIKSIAFHRGVALPEVDKLIGLLSVSEPPEENISQLAQKENITHIEINEVTYDLSKKEAKEKEKFEENMLVDYLMGKLSLSGETKNSLSDSLLSQPEEFAKALEEMGEEIGQKNSKAQNKDKDAAKAEVIADTIQKLGRQLLEQGGGDWSKYKDGLTNAILSLEPILRANVLSNMPKTEGQDKNRVDIMKELSLGLPDDTIVDLLAMQYSNKDTNINKIKGMIDRLLPTQERKAQLTPALKQKLKQLGVSDEECELLFEEKSWDNLPLEEKVKKITQSSMATFLKILPVVRLAPIVKELIALKQEADIEAIENKFIIAWQENVINSEICAKYLEELLNVFIYDSPDELMPKFIAKLLDMFNANPAFGPVFFACLNPSLDRITNLLIAGRKIQLMQAVMDFYAKDAKNSQNLARVLEPITIRLIEELTRRIDANLGWAELLDTFILLKDQAARPLIERALFEKGVPEGKYFEAYLRRRTVGKLLSQIPKDDLLRILEKEKFTDAPPYVVKNLIEIVGAMENENAVQFMAKVFKAADAVIRRKIIFTLGKMKGPSSAELLEAVLKGPDSKLAEEAMEALKNRKDEFAAAILKGGGAQAEP